jgi:ATP-dependent helicase/DNAse subunit B
LSDEDRAAVNKFAGRAVFRLSAGEGVAAMPWRLGEDRLLLYLALCSAEEEVVLSYPRENRAGQAQIASPFLGELTRLTGAQVSHLPGQPAPPLEQVATETRLRERVAIELLSRAELRASLPDPDRAALRARFVGESWLARAGASARVEEERLRFFSDPDLLPGPFTGRTGTPEVRARLAQLLEFGPDRPLSASTLKRFGECAFRGFLTLAVGLEEPDAFEEEMDARGKGSFWHRVLEELFRRLQAGGLIGRPLEEVPATLIDETLEVAAGEIEKENHVGHPALWELDRQRARAMVARLLRSEHRGLPFNQLSPESAELCFGREGAPEAWREVRMPDLAGGPDVFVSGKIDRLDSGRGGVGVVDYKSGIIPTGKQLIENLLETEFQLPLYLYAVRSVAHPTRMEAALLSLRSAKLTNLAEALGQYGDVRLDELISADPQTRRKLQESGRKNLPNTVHTLLGRLRAGEFPIRPKDCSYCSFRPVCRITERRFGEARLD